MLKWTASDQDSGIPCSYHGGRNSSCGPCEREGATAIVCAHDRLQHYEQLVHIPVATIIPRESVQRAIELAAASVALIFFTFL